ncbi:hypothetical protein OV090_31100 [Nannocystis sp. RBIL2]|uniref:hypothetical protein n=1 Tax=Nannocystis sp. RBIL2 TaxID=2996788 RepID=UPI002271EAD6|nr:hypothetical protein [Nannocystis sp. RBIL2]MCY1069229.1 hypothetical protein [Nannocystis sp. RBIL2]
MAMLGCEQKNGDPQDEDSATDASTASGGPGVSSTTDATLGPGTTTTTIGLEPTTTDSSTSTTMGEGERLCQAVCDRLVACGLGDAFNGCPCTPTEAKCSQQWKLTLECFWIDSCESLEAGTSPCWKDFAKATICGDESCEISQEFGEDVPADGCAFNQECLEAPQKRRLVCDQATCVCEIDGVPLVMGCTPSGVCQDAELAAERLEGCCA